MQGLHERSRSILGQVQAQLPDWLWEDLAGLPQRLAEDETPADAECCKASWGRLATAGDSFARGVVEALARDWFAPAPVAPAPGGKPPPQPTRELRLLDLDVAEEEARLAAIARRLSGSASLPLLLLGQRFGVLLARPPLPPADLPMGPRAMCDGLASATTRLGLCSHARLALYRRFDLDGLALYPRFAEAVDAALDEAGILRGMSFVPLRRQAHVAITVAQATGRDALQAVGRASEALSPEGRLPPGAQRGRRDAMSALARYLMRHGRDSNQWSECIEVAESLHEAALANQPAPLEARAWLRKVFGEVGYADDEAGLLAEGLAPAADPGVAEAAGGGAGEAGEAGEADGPRERGVREQRCFERLRQMAPGAALGFSAGRGGFLHARLEEQHDDPPRLLLTCLESECEIIFETDLLARMLASGEAWVVRRAIAAESVP